MLSSWSLATFFVFPLAYRNSHSCLSSGWRLNSFSLLPLFSAIIRSSRHLHNIQVEASIHLPVVSYFQMPGITYKVYSLSLWVPAVVITQWSSGFFDSAKPYPWKICPVFMNGYLGACLLEEEKKAKVLYFHESSYQMFSLPDTFPTIVPYQSSSQNNFLKNSN